MPLTPLPSSLPAPIETIPSQTRLDAQGTGEAEAGRQALDRRPPGTPPGSLPQSEAVSPLSRDDINLLGKHGIVRDPTGVWYHIEEEPSGRTTITPVNCYTNLKTTPVQGDAILQNVCRHVRALM